LELQVLGLGLLEISGATRRTRTGELLITNRRQTITQTGETQPIPMILAFWTST